MEYNLPDVIEYILICYGPLALIVIGFILAAAATDADSRRAYLRNMDIRSEDQRPEIPEPTITERTVAYTPSRSRVILVPPDEEADS
ncbi:MAG: hypothetical protein ACFE0Q_13210 [Anaerolineae bacterium]